MNEKIIRKGTKTSHHAGKIIGTSVFKSISSFLEYIPNYTLWGKLIKDYLNRDSLLKGENRYLIAQQNYNNIIVLI